MTADLWLARAARSLKTAARTSADGDQNAACNRAYYAMFYAARAALIAVGQSERAMGKSHAGLIVAFGEHVVKPGFVESDVGRTFGFEANRRLVADYEGGEMSPDDARAAIRHAENFVGALSSWISAGQGQE